MASAETGLKVLMAATDVWLKGRELALQDITGVPKALWMLQGAVEDIHHHLENDREISKDRLMLYEHGLKNADLLMAFIDSQPTWVKEALKEEIADINEALYLANLALDKKIRPWLV